MSVSTHDQRSQQQIDADITFDRFVVRLAPRQLIREGRPIAIGDRAFDLLVALLRKPNQLFPKSDLVRIVWPQSEVDQGNLRVHISHLRRILGRQPDGSAYIRNIAGRGYSFVSAVSQTAVTEGPGIVGREDDIDAISRLIRERKLVTIVGAGGVGKTTVAKVILRRAEASLNVSTAVVDCSTITDPELVPSLLAAAIGASVLLRHPIESVVNALRGKRKLLLFDSCEHVLPAATQLAESLSASAPDLMILVTSREPLRAEGEWVYRLEPLPIPPHSRSLTNENALRYPAIQLFLARVNATEPSLQLSPSNVSAICQICIALDGSPLAIELAAAQVKFMGLGRLANELNFGFDVLSEDRCTALPRHRTLRRTLDWSYETLTGSEQTALHYLSTFRGTFDFEAASAVAGPGESEKNQFYEDFFQLIEKSLISVDARTGATLYRLLDVTREYASQKLAITDKYADARRRHAGHYLHYLSSRAVQLRSQNTKTLDEDWQTISQRIINDIRGALDWAFMPDGDHELACHLTICSSFVWQQLALLSEYQARSIQALSCIQQENLNFQEEMLVLLLAIGFTDAGGANLLPVADLTGLNAFKSALAYAQKTLHVDSEIDALYGLAVLLVKAGEYDNASSYIERLRELGKKSIEAKALFHRLKALVDAYCGRVTTVLHDLEESDLLYRKLDKAPNQQKLGRFDQRCALNSLKARSLWELGLPEDALAEAKAVTDFAIALGDQLSLCYVLATGACPVAAWSGDRELLSKYTSIFRKVVDEHSLIYWEQWAATFEWGLRARYDACQTQFADLKRFSTFAPLQHEMLATLDPGLLTKQAVDRARAGQAGFSLPEVFRAQGELILLSRPGNNEQKAEQHFHKAYEIAQKNGSLSWSLRAATSLLRLKARTKGALEAKDMVDNVLSKFSQGFLTHDLRVAKRLIEADFPVSKHDARNAVHNLTLSHSITSELAPGVDHTRPFKETN